MSRVSDAVQFKGWKIAWWLCAVTLPWLDTAFNISLILLLIFWLAGGGVFYLNKLKNANWVWPMFGYYAVLLAGMIYTQDIDNGFFTLEKKISFIALPIFAITGRPLEERFITLLKKSFVYSCAVIMLFCVVATSIHFSSGGSFGNFNLFTTDNYNNLHPEAPSMWMHFSYIQLSKWASLHPGYFSMYLAFCVIILLTEEFHSTSTKIFHYGLALAMSVFIAMLSSRMAIIAFFCTCFYLIGLKKRKQIIIPILFFLSTVGMLLAFNPVSKFRVIEEPLKTTYLADTSVTQWNSVNYRLLEWHAAWSVITDHPILGVGTGGGTQVLTAFYSHFNQSTIGLQSNAHNQFLQSWMELGSIGLLAFVSCLVGPLILSKSYSNAQYISFIVIFSLMCLTESVGERQKGVVFFAFFQTLYLGLERKTK
ncbi:MAG: O-antigen ligase family protein [Bacteroidetes bacterium]|nr:O-antigen ligase family protein [Bacteroidota bacterium]